MIIFILCCGITSIRLAVLFVAGVVVARDICISWRSRETALNIFVFDETTQAKKKRVMLTDQIAGAVSCQCPPVIRTRCSKFIATL